MVKTRIAPSPTGDPHIGNLYVALINYAFAKRHGGRFILRMEDTDRQRFTPGAEDKFKQALDWLGITPDEGPDQGGPNGPYRQTEKLKVYQQKARELVDAGHAYYCFCTPERLKQMRREQQAKGQQPKYDRHCLGLPPAEIKKRLARNTPHVVRLKIPDKGKTKFTDLVRGEIVFENKLIDDQILLKSDGYPTYHLGVVIDDHKMQISHVIRAEEWISSTPKQILLYRAFGWEPPQFAHLPLLRNPDGSKLSKRRNSVSVLWYQQEGFLPEALKNYLTRLGWSHPQDKEIYDFSEFIKLFDFNRASTSAPVFDIQKLTWLNGVYIREKISPQKYLQYFYDFTPEEIKSLPEAKKKISQIAPLFRERLKKFNEVPKLIDYFFKDISVDKNLLAKQAGSPERAQEMLKSAFDKLSAVKTWNTRSIESALRSLGQEKKWANKEFFMTLRVAATGQTATPPLFNTLHALTQKKVLTRLKKCINPK